MIEFYTKDIYSSLFHSWYEHLIHHFHFPGNIPESCNSNSFHSSALVCNDGTALLGLKAKSQLKQSQSVDIVRQAYTMQQHSEVLNKLGVHHPISDRMGSGLRVWLELG